MLNHLKSNQLAVKYILLKKFIINILSTYIFSYKHYISSCVWPECKALLGLKYRKDHDEKCTQEHAGTIWGRRLLSIILSQTML